MATDEGRRRLASFPSSFIVKEGLGVNIERRCCTGVERRSKEERWKKRWTMEEFCVGVLIEVSFGINELLESELC